MKIDDVKRRAFAMPLTNPSYPPGPYRFVNREFFVITYRTDPEALRAVVPEPLEVAEPLVKYEFIRMPDSTGFGDYTESGQVIPVVFEGQQGGYVHAMYLNDDSPIAGGREIWGFSLRSSPSRRCASRRTPCSGRSTTAPSRIATGTMGYKHTTLDIEHVKTSLEAPSFLLKIVPHVDCGPRVCELVRYYLEDLTVKGAWAGPAALELHHHALAPVADLPVLEVLSGVHIVTDLTLGLGEVVHDYLKG